MPKAPKFFIMYKRAGYRVIINHNGDMIVRPSAVEASIHVAGAHTHRCSCCRSFWQDLCLVNRGTSVSKVSCLTA